MGKLEKVKPEVFRKVWESWRKLSLKAFGKLGKVRKVKSDGFWKVGESWGKLEKV